MWGACTCKPNPSAGLIDAAIIAVLGTVLPSSFAIDADAETDHRSGRQGIKDELGNVGDVSEDFT